MSERATAVVDGEVVDTDTGEVVGALPVRAQREDERFDIASIKDPTGALRVAETLVQTVARKCTGSQYVAQISGKQYPRVEWWTTVGASLGLFPREERSRRLDRDDAIAYEATVGVYRGDHLVTRASAVCSNQEPRWRSADEYAIKSMATTRATGKAYRIGLSFLAVMAGLEPTSAEEMPGDDLSDPSDDPRCPVCNGPMWRNIEKKAKDPKWANAPDYRCRNKCEGGVIEDYEAWKAGRERDGDGDGDEAEALEAAKRDLWGLLANYAAEEPERLTLLRAYAEAEESVPDTTDDWHVEHYEFAIAEIEDGGSEALEGAWDLIAAREAECEEPPRPRTSDAERKAGLIASIRELGNAADGDPAAIAQRLGLEAEWAKRCSLAELERLEAACIEAWSAPDEADLFADES